MLFDGPVIRGVPQGEQVKHVRSNRSGPDCYPLPYERKLIGLLILRLLQGFSSKLPVFYAENDALHRFAESAGNVGD